MTENPFSETDDSERTVIRPAPGGRREAPRPPPDTVAARPPPPVARPPGLEASAEPVVTASFGGGALTDAAGALLQLLARLRNAASAPDAASLRERVGGELRAFEGRARDQKIPPELVRPAHYALCASIDDVVLNTPWGGAGGWGAQSLVGEFHPDLGGAERFFDVLAKIRASPERFMPLIELMYLCLSLGYMGSARGSPRGAAEIDKLRGETYAVLPHVAGPADPPLSPHSRGVDAPYRPGKASLPVWVAAAACAAALGGLFVWVSTDLAAASDTVAARMLASQPSSLPQFSRAEPVVAPPPPPPPDEPTFLDRLHAALKAEIDAGVVSLGGNSGTPVVRIHNRNMFAAGSARLQPGLVAVLEHVGSVLGAEPGPIVVAAYTDNQPIRTVQFPSNVQLSAARANAARAVLARKVAPPARVSAEGRGDADPLAPNTSAEGREQNRRIEVTLRRES